MHIYTHLLEKLWGKGPAGAEGKGLQSSTLDRDVETNDASWPKQLKGKIAYHILWPFSLLTKDFGGHIAIQELK